MRILQVLLEAFRAMGMNRLRTALTMLGMIIGVGAVVMMLGIGQGAQSRIEAAIVSMGSNLLIAMPGATSASGMRVVAGASSLSMSDAAALGEIPSVAVAAPVVFSQYQVVAGGNNWRTTIFGVTAEYFALRSWELESGDVFGDDEQRTYARVALIGQTIADNLFPDDAPIGKIVRIRNSPYTVIGVMAKKGQSFDGRDQDDNIFVPLTTARQQLMRGAFPGSVSMIMAQAKTPDQLADAEVEMNQTLRLRHRLREGQEDDFTVRNLTAMAETAAVATRTMSLMLGAIASISLLVGGIGIMNIMLVSVTERTKEIGIRLAVGARRRDVMVQFLVEAMVMSLIGGVLGVGIGLATAQGLTAVLDWPTEVSLTTVASAFGIAALVGIVFGYYPARRASRLDPIESLRYE